MTPQEPRLGDAVFMPESDGPGTWFGVVPLDIAALVPGLLAVTDRTQPPDDDSIVDSAAGFALGWSHTVWSQLPDRGDLDAAAAEPGPHTVGRDEVLFPAEIVAAAVNIASGLIDAPQQIRREFDHEATAAFTVNVWIALSALIGTVNDLTDAGCDLDLVSDVANQADDLLEAAEAAVGRYAVAQPDHGDPSASSGSAPEAGSTWAKPPALRLVPVPDDLSELDDLHDTPEREDDHADDGANVLVDWIEVEPATPDILAALDLDADTADVPLIVINPTANSVTETAWDQMTEHAHAHADAYFVAGQILDDPDHPIVALHMWAPHHGDAHPDNHAACLITTFCIDCDLPTLTFLQDTTQAVLADENGNLVSVFLKPFALVAAELNARRLQAALLADDGDPVAVLRLLGYDDDVL